MKLYFSPGACSMAPHIILNELGINCTLEKVDLKAHTYSGGDFYKVNPKGYVPFIETDSGDKFSELAVIAQYLADSKPEKNLTPKFGTPERYHLMEMMNFLATEVHKSFGPLFAGDRMVPADAVPQLKKFAADKLSTRFDFLNQRLAKTQWLMGDQFTIADAYLFVFMQWAKKMNLEMTKFPALMSFTERAMARPAIQKTLKDEGLN